ncbi:MAG: MFS transporter [Planctomycetaceae bacterium]
MTDPEPLATAQSADDRRAEIARNEPRNLLVFACYEIVFRIAWIFKTESVIVPAFVDALTGGAGTVRGWLPMLARVGQSLPPLFYSDRLRDQPLKAKLLRLTTTLMALPTAAIAWIALAADGGPQPWMAIAFLGLHVLFFSVTGINQLCVGTLHGKLLRADRRGRLMWLGGVIGPILAIAAAWWLLGDWLEGDSPARFMPIFTFTAAGFIAGSLIALLVKEPVDVLSSEPRQSPLKLLKGAFWVYRSDSGFRRAANVVMLLTTIVILFPHFQWLARKTLGAESQRLMVWVVAQNIGVACFSPFCGSLADRSGNRIVLRLQCVVLAIAPLLALFIAGPLHAWYPETRLYWVVFVLLGMAPVTMRTITNYTLELVQPELHPLYLSTMRICFLIPFVFAPAAGWLLDISEADPYRGACWLFSGISLLVAIAGALTFRMIEPRWIAAAGTSNSAGEARVES